MTRQYVQRTQKSPTNDDSWILQRTAVREIPAKAKTPQVPRESLAEDKPRIKLDLTQIPVSSHECAARTLRDRPVVRPPLMVGKARDTSGQHSLPAKPELRNGWESQNLAIHNWEGGQGMPVQAKLTIGQPHDKYEQEADRVASQVVQQINAPASTQSTQGQSVQRQLERSEEELQAIPDITSLQGRKEPARKVQTKLTLQGADAIASGEASSELTSAINSARGGGQPLDASLQQSMGQAMGADFSGVRVHTDARSDQLNQSIQAKAFTTGEDVFFRQGEYQPGTRGGQETIAHELTHVVQQNGGAVRRSPFSQPQLSQHSASETLSKVEGEGEVQGRGEVEGDRQDSSADRRPNQTGLPDVTKSGNESLSGISMDKVNVHYNSSQPAQLNTKAYAQGSDIHVAPGQERHLMTVPRDTIQRLVGFEFEMDVPITTTNYHVGATAPGVGGAKVDSKVEQFMISGPAYATPIYNEPSGLFDAVTDHPMNLQLANRDLYLAYEKQGLVRKWEQGSMRNIANIEYRTPPTDEMAAGSNTIFKMQLNGVGNHARAIIGNKPSINMTRVPTSSDPAMHVGVPYNEMIAAAPGNADVQAAANRLRDATQPNINMQATIGIVPAGIGSLHQDWETSGLDTTNDMFKLANQWTKKLHNDLWTKYEASKISKSIGSVVKFRGLTPEQANDAIDGLFWLICSYLVGQSIRKTNAWTEHKSHKNAVPFMVKMIPNNLISALPDAIVPPSGLGRPDLSIPQELINFVKTWYGDVSAALAPDQVANMLSRDLKRTVSVDPGAPNVIVDVGEMIKAFLGGHYGQIPVAPVVSSPRTVGPDPINEPRITAAHGTGTAGITMEVRRWPTLRGFDAVGPAVESLLTMVRNANMQKLGHGEKDALIRNF